MNPRHWLFLLSLLAVPHLAAQSPEWIWTDGRGTTPAANEVRYFRKVFTVSGRVTKALLVASGDNQVVAYVNGRRVGESRDWNRPLRQTVTADLKPGENVIALRGRNSEGDAALIARLEITLEGGTTQTVVTDTSWLAGEQETAGWEKPGFQATAWAKPITRGKLGVQPWGDVMTPPVATPADRLDTLPGFRVELIRSSEPGEGSWICMAIDARGRLIVSPQDDNQPLLRITLTPAGQVGKVEAVPAPVRQAMGMTWAHNSLYVNGHGPKGTGLYRLVDANQNDQFDADEVRFLKTFKGEGEHGYHAVVEGPDGMIYVMNGNHTKVPDGISPESPHRNYAEDHVLPRDWDGNGHAAGILAPGGYIVRTDPDGQKWELLLAGFRNSYDFDFNPDGEIFTFDSDMEWDWGTPWYRPTRINHCVVGGEYGWRSGTGKWPEYYPDSLPATVNIGIGSPTGVKFGTQAKFPEKYRRALYAMDWSYGRILAVHLTPEGATYRGTFENLVAPKGLTGTEGKSPLNVTDMEIGQDGALYFTTGGRGTQSGLYRVSYVGQESPGPADLRQKQGAEARALRRKLEGFHGRKDPAAVTTAWPHLSSPDRWIRYAARIAIESQPVDEWASRALNETHPDAALTALVALARCGGKDLQVDLLEALGRLDASALDESRKLAALRVLQLAFVRMGRPNDDVASAVVTALDPAYPNRSELLNRELAQLMIYLQAPGVVADTLMLMDASVTQESQLHYIFHLRTLKEGWTLDQRKHYFGWWNRDRKNLGHPAELVQWFADVGRGYSDGASWAKFLQNFRKTATDLLTAEERKELEPILSGKPPSSGLVARPRTLVKEWTLADLVPSLDKVSRGRNFERGRQAYADAQCSACHIFNGEGGSVGPELTAASSKYTRRDILESMLEPSKVVSEQYQNTTLLLKDGDEMTGRIMDETAERIVLVTDPLKGTRRELKKADVQARQPSKLSPMPEGLLAVLPEDEILDLLAYMESGGRPGSSQFKP